MRVLHVIEAATHGTGRHLLDLVAGVAAEHHVVVPGGASVRGVPGGGDAVRGALGATGARILTAPMTREVWHPSNAVAVATVRRAIRRVQPQIVHGHSAIGGMIARLASAGAGVPTVFTPNGLLPSRAALAVERRVGRLTDRFVAVSSSEAALAHREGLVPPGAIVTIPNGISLDLPTAPGPGIRARLALPPSTPLVGFVGRFARQKAPEVLVAATVSLVERVPDVQVVMVGNGPTRDTVWRMRRALGLDGRVHLVPHHDGIAAALGELDVLAHPSRWEGGPYVPLEAMRAGTPVVVSDAVGCVDVVEDGISGLVVPVDDPGALVVALGRVLTDQGFAADLAEQGRARLAERFDVRAMCAAHARLYAELAA